jgi:hypothetical protein
LENDDRVKKESDDEVKDDGILNVSQLISSDPMKEDDIQQQFLSADESGGHGE